MPMRIVKHINFYKIQKKIANHRTNL